MKKLKKGLKQKLNYKSILVKIVKEGSDYIESDYAHINIATLNKAIAILGLKR